MVVRGRRNPLYFGLSVRLKKARKAANYTWKGLADRAGLAHSLVKAVEIEGRVPIIDTVERLAQALGLSPCFLAYGIDLPFAHSEHLRAEGVGRRLFQARATRGSSKAALARAAGVARGMVIYVEDGRTTPSVATAEQIANALGVSPGWLAYGEGPEVLPKPVRRRKISAE